MTLYKNYSLFCVAKIVITVIKYDLSKILQNFIYLSFNHSGMS